VVLYVPSENEIFEAALAGPGKDRLRRIFLNTPLTENEKASLQALHEALENEDIVTRAGDGTIPQYGNLHALRILQHRKYNIPKAIQLLETHLKERVKRLPISESSVSQELKKGFMYWHGRDVMCRPVLVIRLERIGDLITNKERAVLLVIFVLEYAIRFALAPGRVENWVVLVDMLNASKVVKVSSLYSLMSTAKAISDTLESLYCARMVWMKMLNVPGYLKSAVEKLIPTAKKDKVAFCTEAQIKTSLTGLIEPHQLEARYGGTAPDLRPEETYPFHFFPNATGEGREGDMRSLHQHSTRAFHEGALWDDSTKAAKAFWFNNAASESLTPMAAAAYTGMEGATKVEPCADAARWLELVGHEEAQSKASMTASREPSQSEEPDEKAAQQEPEPRHLAVPLQEGGEKLPFIEGPETARKCDCLC